MRQFGILNDKVEVLLELYISSEHQEGMNGG